MLRRTLTQRQGPPRDKVEILNIEPVPNTRLERGSIVTVTADVRYVLDSHVKAPIVLHYEYQRDASGGVFGQTFSERIDVGIGEGTVTLTGTLEVPDLDSTNVAVIMEPPGDAVQSAGFDCWDQPLAMSKGAGYPILVRSPEPTATPTATATAIPTMAPTVAPTPTAELPYRLEVSAAPEGAGTVQMFPAAVDNLYSRGTVVVITALCRFGFLAWAGEVPGEVSPTTGRHLRRSDADPYAGTRHRGRAHQRWRQRLSRYRH